MICPRSQKVAVAELEQAYKSLTPGPGPFPVITHYFLKLQLTGSKVLKGVLTGETEDTKKDLDPCGFAFKGVMSPWNTGSP